jgi:antitoxin MazE
MGIKTRLIRTGSSRGVRIPKAFIEQCNLGDTVELSIEGNRLIISPVKENRQGWQEAFEEMAQLEDDQLLISDDISHSWDSDEWEWK